MESDKLGEKDNKSPMPTAAGTSEPDEDEGTIRPPMPPTADGNADSQEKPGCQEDLDRPQRKLHRPFMDDEDGGGAERKKISVLATCLLQHPHKGESVLEGLVQVPEDLPCLALPGAAARELMADRCEEDTSQHLVDRELEEGELLLPNWRPLRLGEHQVCRDATVGEVLGQLTSVPRIRVKIRCRNMSEDKEEEVKPEVDDPPTVEDPTPNPSEVNAARDRLMQFFVEQYWRDLKGGGGGETDRDPKRFLEALYKRQLTAPLIDTKWSATPPNPNPESNKDETISPPPRDPLLFSTLISSSSPFPRVVNTLRTSSLTSTSTLTSSLTSTLTPDSTAAIPPLQASAFPFLRGKETPFHSLFGQQKQPLPLHRDQPPSLFLPQQPTTTTSTGALGVPFSTSASNSGIQSTSYSIAKPRMRVCFDPETEIPRLQKWFAQNNHPTRQQVEQYVKELNSLDSRRGRKSLDVNNVIYWFKNTRAAVKRQEVKIRQLQETLGLQTPTSTQSHFPKKINSIATTTTTQNLTAPPPPPILPSQPPSQIYPTWSSWMAAVAASGFAANNNNNNNNSGSAKGPLPLNLNAGSSQCWLSKEEEKGKSAKRPRIDDEKNDEVIVEDEDEKASPSLSRSPSPVSPPPAPPPPLTSFIPNRNLEEDAKKDDVVFPSSFLYSAAAAAAAASNHHPFLNPTAAYLSQYVGPFLQQQHLMAKQTGVSSELSSPSSSSASPPVSSSIITPNTSPSLPLPPPPALSFGPHHLTPPTPSQGGILTPSLFPFGGGSNASLLDPERRKRNRTFIDPVSEVPRLEEWFTHNTHPSHTLIARYTEELNRLPYRQKFPQLEQKNIQFWFKNRRAKCKRMNVVGSNNNSSNSVVETTVGNGINVD